MCWGCSTFLIVDLTFHGHLQHTSQFRHQQPCTCLGSHSSLADCTNDTFEVVTAWCQNYFSKMGWSFRAVWPRSLHPRGLHMTCNPATATIESTSEWAEIARSMHRHFFRSPIHGSIWKKSLFLRRRHEFRPTSVSEPGVRIGCHTHRTSATVLVLWPILVILAHFGPDPSTQSDCGSAATW